MMATDEVDLTETYMILEDDLLDKTLPWGEVHHLFFERGELGLRAAWEEDERWIVRPEEARLLCCKWEVEELHAFRERLPPAKIVVFMLFCWKGDDDEEREGEHVVRRVRRVRAGEGGEKGQEGVQGQEGEGQKGEEGEEGEVGQALTWMDMDVVLDVGMDVIPQEWCPTPPPPPHPSLAPPSPLSVSMYLAHCQ